ncbi:MAG: hypothetical protein QNJ32_11090 [Xenococcaceae cyanobacterium MO_167.B27]|nr:hypothetical protein [Xenococcaceae cyanobacterium MO_167.B27]
MAQPSSSPQKSHLVSKPWEKGTVNLFNPPKRDPNGRLASSRLYSKDISLQSKVSSQKYQENNREFFNCWRISAIAIILLTNTISTFVILTNKLHTPSVTQKPETTPKIIAGKTNLAAQEFITPNLNSLSHISVTSQGNNIVEQDINSEVPVPLAIPPTNLPSQAITSSHNTNTSYYYVLTEYTGEESLHLAQQQVKNVSLLNFPQGVFIYMGAFSEKNLAEQFIDNIQEKGLQGYIYPSDSN